jgi:hypothetical protein
MEVFENETSIKVLVLNVTVGAAPEGWKPDPEIAIWVSPLLTETLSITTAVAPAAGRPPATSKIMRHSDNGALTIKSNLAEKRKFVILGPLIAQSPSLDVSEFPGQERTQKGIFFLRPSGSNEDLAPPSAQPQLSCSSLATSHPPSATLGRSVKKLPWH